MRISEALTITLAVAGVERWVSDAPAAAAKTNFWSRWRICEKGKGQARIAACT